MERVADVINKICQKYALLIKNLGIEVELDFPDTTLVLHEKNRVERDLERAIKSAVDRTHRGQITIVVRPGRIIIKDNGTVLSKTACRLFTTKHVEVKSRVGFGTTVTIKH